jgi:hypothetical protein
MGADEAVASGKGALEALFNLPLGEPLQWARGGRGLGVQIVST